MAAARTQKKATANTGRAARTRTSAPSSRRRTPARKPSQQRRGGSSRARRGRISRTGLIVIVVSIVVAAWMVYPVLRLQYQQEREVKSLEAELEDVRSRNDELREQVDELKTPEGIEKLARDGLGLVKPGEQAYVVTGGSIGETTPTVLSQQTVEPPVWLQMLDAVFGFD
jgi:cell division protein FtsB